MRSITPKHSPALETAALDSDRPTSPRALGARLGGYRLLEFLGGGSSGGSYMAEHVDAPGRLMVCKTVHDSHGVTPELAAERHRALCDEIELGRRLAHPGIASVLDHDLGRHGEPPYLITELLDGVPLERLVRSLTRIGRVLPCALAGYVVHELASALGHLHRARGTGDRPLGLIHGRMRPKEALLLRDGSVKLLTFGPYTTSLYSPSPPRRIRGVITYAEYRAPEQLLGMPVDARADVFALGALLWELLVGPPLFRGRSEEEASASVLAHEIPRPSSLRPEIPSSLDDIVLAALAQDPRERTANADRLARQLAKGLPTRTKLLGYGSAWVTSVLGPASSGRPVMADDDDTESKTPALRTVKTTTPLSVSGSITAGDTQRVPPPLPPPQPRVEVRSPTPSPPRRSTPPPIPPAARTPARGVAPLVRPTPALPPPIPESAGARLQLVPPLPASELRKLPEVHLPRPRTQFLTPQTPADQAGVPTSFVTMPTPTGTRRLSPWLSDSTPTETVPRPTKPSRSGNRTASKSASTSWLGGLIKIAAIAGFGFSAGALWQHQRIEPITAAVGPALASWRPILSRLPARASAAVAPTLAPSAAVAPAPAAVVAPAVTPPVPASAEPAASSFAVISEAEAEAQAQAAQAPVMVIKATVRRSTKRRLLRAKRQSPAPALAVELSTRDR